MDAKCLQDAVQLFTNIFDGVTAIDLGKQKEFRLKLPLICQPMSSNSKI